MKDEHKPVWIAFPKIPWGSIGWRMGPGEDYWHYWVPWFKALSSEARAKYKAAWPEPDGWQGFYGFVETGATPPWLTDQQRLTAEAAKPPTPEETDITAYHRVVWLIRQHMKRLRADATQDDEGLAEPYSAPDGSQWRLSASKTKGGMHLKRVPST